MAKKKSGKKAQARRGRRGAKGKPGAPGIAPGALRAIIADMEGTHADASIQSPSEGDHTMTASP